LRFFDAPFNLSPPFFSRLASNWQSPLSPSFAALRFPFRSRRAPIKKIGRTNVGSFFPTLARPISLNARRRA
jgi:hypothetical protein